MAPGFLVTVETTRRGKEAKLIRVKFEVITRRLNDTFDRKANPVSSDASTRH
jgi:hypothetical protein